MKEYIFKNHCETIIIKAKSKKHAKLEFSKLKNEKANRAGFPIISREYYNTFKLV